MQVLYQIDATGVADAEALHADLDDEHGKPAVRDAAVELALAAWQHRAGADARVAALAPDWPTHRQPPIDRAILRLAVHDMTTGRSPAKVAINEAVELAKQFSHENAPSFINGVLDKLHRQLPAPPPQDAVTPAPQNQADPDAWLTDAKTDS